MDEECAYCEYCRILRTENATKQRACKQSASRGFRVRTSSGPYTVKASNFANGSTVTGMEFVLRNSIIGSGRTLEILNIRANLILPTTRRSHRLREEIIGRKRRQTSPPSRFQPLPWLHPRWQHYQRRDCGCQSEQLAFEQKKYDFGKIKHKDFSKNLKFRRPHIRVSGDVLAHAKLWIFADRNLIDGLKSLCLHMLHQELLVFKITPSSVDDIFELLSYVYDPEHTRESDENTAEDGGDDFVNELRDLVMSSAACIINDLREFHGYRETLRNGGDLAADMESLES